MKYLIPVVLLLTGCASITKSPGILEAPRVQKSPLEKQLINLPAPINPRMTIAVYGFQDKTGARKTMDNYASFSAAVTQGAEAWLIDSLRLAGQGKKDNL
jgi:hypothetical protein